MNFFLKVCVYYQQVMPTLGDTPIAQAASSATTTVTAPITPDVPLPPMPAR